MQSLRQGEYTTGSAQGGGFMTNLGNIYFPPNNQSTSMPTATTPITSYGGSTNPPAPRREGSVLGATDTRQSGSSGPDLSNPVKQDEYAKGQGYDGWDHMQSLLNEARDRENDTRNSINTGFDEYVGNLHGMKDMYGNQKNESLNSASSIYDQIFGGLEDQKQANLSKLDSNRDQVGERKVQSVKELQQNLSNVVRGVGMQLGALGAGDTSATQVMMPYAYTKIAGQQEGGIHKQANQQMFEIDQQEVDTENQFSQMWRQTEVEKEQQMQGIRDYYGDAIARVQSALASAPLEKQQALASLNQSLLSEAKSKLTALETETRQRQNDIQSWATQRLGELNNAKIQLAGTANFNPREIVFNEMQMMGGPQPSGVGVGQEPWNPMAVAQKRRDEYLA